MTGGWDQIRNGGLLSSLLRAESTTPSTGRRDTPKADCSVAFNRRLVPPGSLLLILEVSWRLTPALRRPAAPPHPPLIRGRGGRAAVRRVSLEPRRGLPQLR